MRSQSTRRQFLRMASFGAAASLLAACQPKVVEVTSVVKEVVKETVVVEGEAKVVEVEKEVTRVVETAKEAGPVTNLRYQIRSGAESPELWTAFFTYFHDKYPNIRVEALPNPGGGEDGLRENLIAQMVAGDAPDVYQLCCWTSAYFIQQGQALKLQPLIDRDTEEINMSDFSTQQFQAWTMDGDIYAMPWYTGIMGIFYNRTLFDELGVAYPPSEWGELSFDDYRAMCNQFVRKEDPQRWGSCAYYLLNDWICQMWLRGFGANMVNPKDNTECLLCTPEAQECLEIIRQMTVEEESFAHARRVAGSPDVRGLMSSQRSGMVEIGSWHINSMLQDSGADTGDPSWEWDAAPMWSGPAGITTHISVDGQMVWTNTPHPEEAWKLCMELAGPEFERYNCRYEGAQPSRKSVLPYWLEQWRARYPYLENVNIEIFAEAIEKNYGAQEEIFRYDGTSKNEILGPVMEKSILLNEAPVSIICDAAEIVTRFNRDEIKYEDIGAEVQRIIG